jgi:hypothetical protein
MVRSVVAVLVGVVIATVGILALESLGHLVYPLPEGVNPNDMEALKKVLPTMPVGAFLCVLFMYAVGSFVGGLIAGWIARRAQTVHALIVGAILMALGVVNMLMLPHPGWFWAASLLVYLPPAYLGSRLAPRPPSAPQPRPAESLAA